MTVLTAEPTVVVAPTGFWTRSRKAGLIYILLGVVAVVFWGLLAGHGADARFTASENANGTSVPIPSRVGAIIGGVIAIVCGGLLMWSRTKRRFALWSTIAVVGLVFGFLCWQISGNTIPLGSSARLTVFLALPLILGAMAGVLCERSGVINVAIEGQFLMGAFLGAFFGTVAASPWVGLIAAMFGGALVAAMLAWLAIRYLVDQVVLGIVLNLLALGLTSFLYQQIMQPDSASFNDAPAFAQWRIPLLSDIPIIGPALFEQNVIVYIAIVLVISVHIGLFHTRWGLRTRSVGEHPIAADTVGIRVLAVRYRNVLIAGLIAGIGGAFFTIGSQLDFSKNMTVGKGFIALAALIFGRWSPIGATLAALLFGFTDQLQGYLALIGSSVPSEFLAMLPYAVTIVAVAGLVGRVRAPAADGKPYIKG
jgi:simple sugar transport system permease protein